jgi:DEAD/DEAH box helicase domain-containing protein
LRALEARRPLAGRVVHRRHLDAQEGDFADLPAGLHPALAAALRAQGIERLYSHQAEAVVAALGGADLGACLRSVAQPPPSVNPPTFEEPDSSDGFTAGGGCATFSFHDLTVVTPTASGKSLCYQIPILETALRDPAACALVLYPTKALAHDQLGRWQDWARRLDLKPAAGARGAVVATYDGDTPAGRRGAVRAVARIVLTNPDMLHAGILPQHAGWARFLAGLRWVVLDEIHTYRGVFGSHVANLLRRLERLGRFHGAAPRFLCCSATIANPAELAEALTGRPHCLISRGGAPRGERTVLLYDPPQAPWVPFSPVARRSFLRAVRRLALHFLRHGAQTVVFARTRRQVELLTTSLRRAVERLGGDPASVLAYRGGYLPEERRAIEAAARTGSARAIVSTNALELGVDLGGLDVVILAGYPGSVASAWQQMGRAGRGGVASASAAVLVAAPGPLDRFLLAHPDLLFEAPHEGAVLNARNAAILRAHVAAAAYELPLDEGERLGDADCCEALEELAARGLVRHSGRRWYWAGAESPASSVSLRAASGRRFAVLDASDADRVVAEVDAPSVPFLLHPGAIYLHQGRPYEVVALDSDAGTAHVRPSDAPYFTEAVATTHLRVQSVAATQALAPGGAARSVLGTVSVRTEVTHYRRLRWETQEEVGRGEVSLPETVVEAEAWWVEGMGGAGERVRASAAGVMDNMDRMDAMDLMDVREGLAGVAALLGQVAPLTVLCDREDFRVVALPRGFAPGTEEEAPDAGRGNGAGGTPVIVFHEMHEGGVGLARRAFETAGDLLGAALDVVRRCPCARGCPACVGPERRGATPGVRKHAAARLLAAALRR